MAGVLLKGKEARARRILKMRKDKKKARPVDVNLFRDTLYHRLQVMAGTTYSFFRSLGAGTTIHDTNLISPGKPNYNFDAIGILLWVQYGITKENWTTFYNNAILDFKVMGKDMLRLPVHRVPSGGGPQGFASTTNPGQEIFFASNGEPSPNAHFPLHVEGASLYIPQTVDIEAVVNLAQALTTSTYVTVAIDGFKSMPSFM